MRYFKITDKGFHQDWGGDPTYWLEVNEHGDAERQLEKYPNGNIVSYDRIHSEDEHGALAVMVVDGDEDWWAQYEIAKDEFEQEWRTHYR
jgi:hypothetical protein